MEMCNRECIARNLILSSKELRRLFREQKSLLNDLHFAQQVIYRPKRHRGLKDKDAKGPSVNYLRNVYLKTVVGRIHRKRRQIEKALELQVVLRRKRSKDTVVKSPKGGKKHLDMRQKKGKDEL